MDQSQALEITRQGLTVALMVAAPILSVALFLGLIVSVFQAMTQVQEMTLTFVPKMVGAALVTLFFGHWMLTTLVQFTRVCFEQAAQLNR
jgi:flagellar biosynthetic protein FliQ